MNDELVKAAEYIMENHEMLSNDLEYAVHIGATAEFIEAAKKLASALLIPAHLADPDASQCNFSSSFGPSKE